MGEPATTEELRQLRTAVAALTKMTHAMYRQLIVHGIAPIPDMTRYVGNLRLEVLDDDLRNGWEREQQVTTATIREIVDRQPD